MGNNVDTWFQFPLGMRFSLLTPDEFRLLSKQLPLYYSQSWLEYQLEYAGGRQVWEMAIMSITSGNSQAIWPIFKARSGEPQLTNFGPDLRPPVFLNLVSRKFSDKVLRCTFEWLSSCGVLPNSKIRLNPVIGGKIHPWVENSLQYGMSINPLAEVICDLRLDLDEIKKSLSKSTRYDIRQGEKHFSLDIYGSNMLQEDWQEFRELHREVSGRETRSRDSWDLQFENLKSDNATFVSARYGTSNKLVGGMYVDRSKLDALYSVAATDRNFFEMGIGVNHAMQWKLIEFLKGIGVEKYVVGYREMSGTKSQKVQNIDLFKSKFGTREEIEFEIS